MGQAAALLERWPEGEWTPGLDSGLAVQAVCEAIELAAAERRWVDVAEVTASLEDLDPAGISAVRPHGEHG